MKRFDLPVLTLSGNTASATRQSTPTWRPPREMVVVKPKDKGIQLMARLLLQPQCALPLRRWEYPPEDAELQLFWLYCYAPAKQWRRQRPRRSLPAPARRLRSGGDGCQTAGAAGRTATTRRICRHARQPAKNYASQQARLENSPSPALSTTSFRLLQQREQP